MYVLLVKAVGGIAISYSYSALHAHFTDLSIMHKSDAFNILFNAPPRVLLAPFLGYILLYQAPTFIGSMSKGVCMVSVL